jgi:hypothetical protein
MVKNPGRGFITFRAESITGTVIQDQGFLSFRWVGGDSTLAAGIAGANLSPVARRNFQQLADGFP